MKKGTGFSAQKNEIVEEQSHINHMRTLNWPFQHIITFVLIPLLIFVIIVTGFTALQIAESVQETIVANNAKGALRLTIDYIEGQLKELVSVAIRIRDSSIISTITKELANHGSISSSAHIELQTLLDNLFANYYHHLDAIVINFEAQPHLVFSRKIHVTKKNFNLDWEDSGWTEIQKRHTVNWHIPHDGADQTAESTEAQFPFGLSMIAESYPGERFLVYLSIKDSLLQNAISNLLSSESSLVLLLGDNTVIPFGSSPVDALFAQSILSQKNPSGVISVKGTTIVYETLNINDWKIAMCFSNSDIYRGTNAVRKAMYFVISIIILLSIGIGILFSWIIALPLKNLTQKVYSINVEQLDAVQFDSSNFMFKEIVVLADSLNKLLERIHQLMKDIEKRQTEKQILQNSLLQAQINPHFLYNTLYAIAQECNMGEQQEAAEMLYELSTFFRLGLNAGREIVKLGDEQEHVRNYLSLLTRSLTKKFDFHFDIPHKMLEYGLPKMTLQPIIENCLKHGLKEKEGACQIRISARILNANLYEISISDNGVGMSLSTLTRVRHNLSTGKVSTQGFGITNINQRIKLFYGENFGLSIKSNAGKGTDVYITLPIHVV